ncbi:hypothetical protein HDV06_002994 [Boothiomyces sp. JEL0866]|nr:hypothetical protein HDV06_000390 [Boothiomyces sp. JEL0866]KAJ3322450.1 hypothetical protein HDV06_002994 [Boothiomyces sp. JEL0866]
MLIVHCLVANAVGFLLTDNPVLLEKRTAALPPPSKKVGKRNESPVLVYRRKSSKNPPQVITKKPVITNLPFAPKKQS